MKKILIVMLYFVLPAVSFATNKQESIERCKFFYDTLREELEFAYKMHKPTNPVISK